jgi:hypothetical protein
MTESSLSSMDQAQIVQICLPQQASAKEPEHAHIGGSARGYLAVGGASQQSRYDLLDGRLFCIFIHRHPWGECPHQPPTERRRHARETVPSSAAGAR